MSRSKHQTLKSIFGGKSISEVKKIIAEKDPEFLEFLEKRRIKKQVREKRRLQKIEFSSGEE